MGISFHFSRLVCGIVLAGVCSAAAAEVVVVVSAKSTAAALSTEQAADIFLGRSNTLVPLDQAEGSAVRDEFYQKAAGKSSAQLKAYWSQKIFSGKGQPPKSAADSAAVKAMLASNPTMVGYIDKASVDATVKTLATIK